MNIDTDPAKSAAASNWGPDALGDVTPEKPLLTSGVRDEEFPADTALADFGVHQKEITVIKAIALFFQEDIDALLKTCASITKLVGAALFKAGQFDKAEEANRVSRVFTQVKSGLGAIAAPLSIINGLGAILRIHGKGALKATVEAAQHFCSAAYSAADTVALFAQGKLSLVAQKVVDLVSIFGGLLSPVFGLTKSALDLKDALLLKTTDLSFKNYKKESLITSNLESAKSAAIREGFFKVLKNICYIAMSVIATLGIFAAITMSPVVAAIVMSVLSLTSVVFTAAAYVSSEQKDVARRKAIFDVGAGFKPESPLLADSSSPLVDGSGSEVNRLRTSSGASGRLGSENNPQVA